MPLPMVAAGTIMGMIIVPLVIRVLIALGVGFVTYNGVNLLIDAAYDLIINQFVLLPEEMIQLMGIANVDKFMTIIFSAYTIKLTLAGLYATGSISKVHLGPLFQNGQYPLL